MDNYHAASNMSSNAALWTWDELIGALRTFGGTADNIGLGSGRFGRGLFPLDRARPVLLRIPKNLLFPVDDIEFPNDEIRIRDSAPIGRPERDFFENYQRSFSWGAVRSESAAFVDAMDDLPSEVRRFLGVELGMDEFFEGDRAARIGRRFLNSRLITWNNRDVVMPLIELANHSSLGFPYQIDDDGLQIQGKAEDEIFASYGTVDPVRLFVGFGFASPAFGAFSFPMKLTLGKFQLTVDSELHTNVQRGVFMAPRLKREGSNLVLSYLMIGHSKFPRASRGIFRALMKETGMAQAEADEGFDRILHHNRMKFLALLAAVESCEGAMADTLRKMARYQIEAMAHCIGSRDPQSPAPSVEKVWRLPHRS